MLGEPPEPRGGRVVLMLEGGNAQLRGFLDRHALTRDAFATQQQQLLQQQQQQEQQQQQQQQQEQQPPNLNRRDQHNTTAPPPPPPPPSSPQRRQQRQQRSVLTVDNLATLRYKTKAALFYKSQLEAHVDKLLEDPDKRPYTGRSRRPTRQASASASRKTKPSSSSSSSSS
eukprot:jgi/Psemu1/54712/gm1.54712_g